MVTFSNVLSSTLDITEIKKKKKKRKRMNFSRIRASERFQCVLCVYVCVNACVFVCYARIDLCVYSSYVYSCFFINKLMMTTMDG